VDNRPQGHHATHQHGKHRRTDAASGAPRPAQPNRDHRHPPRNGQARNGQARNGHAPNGHARNGAPVYGERLPAPASQTQGSQSGPNGQASQGGQDIAGVGFMRRPVSRRDDARRSPR
jgi:hypothetical protein